MTPRRSGRPARRYWVITLLLGIVATTGCSTSASAPPPSPRPAAPPVQAPPATTAPQVTPRPTPQPAPAQANSTAPTADYICLSLGPTPLINAKGAVTAYRDLNICGLTEPTPAVALPRNLSLAFPSEQVCRNGLALTLACDWQVGHMSWRDFAARAKLGIGGAAPGWVRIWWATGDVFDCAVPTGGAMSAPSEGLCVFRYNTPTAWHLEQYFRADALAQLAGPNGCAPPLHGEITSSMTGNRIRVTLGIHGPKGFKTIDGIFDTGAAHTLLPDQWLRDAGFQPLYSTQVSGVGSGPTPAYVYRVPRPVILDGDVWAPTGQGYIYVMGAVGFDLPLLSPELLKDGGMALSTQAGRWTLTFPCQK